MNRSPDARELYRALVRSIESVQAIDTRCHEGEPAAKLIECVLPTVRIELDEARQILGRVLMRYDRESEPPPPPSDDLWDRGFDYDVDTLVGDRGRGARIADLAFMAQLELRQKSEALERARSSDDGWAVIEVVDSARRRVAKSLTAVCAVLSETEGLEPRVGFATELDRSLQVRRRYARLRQSIGLEDELEGDALYERLRGVGTQIAILVGHRVYPELRVADRRAIRELQQRILSWLRTQRGTPADQQAGHRLWQDLSAFARMLGQISQRQELIEHDTKVLDEAQRTLERPGRCSEIPAPLMESLRALRGLDEGIDSLLGTGTGDPAAWREALRGLAPRLRRGRPLPTRAENGG